MPTYAGTDLLTTCTFYPASSPPPNGAPADPTTITCKFGLAGQAPTTWTYGGAGSITRTSAGIYGATIPTAGLVGALTIEWEGTGAVGVVGVTSILLAAPPL